MRPPTLGGSTVRFQEVTGAKIANQTMMIEPAGCEAGRASEDPIKSPRHQVCARANSFTLGINQVLLCGDDGEPSHVKVRDSGGERERWTH